MVDPIIQNTENKFIMKYSYMKHSQALKVCSL